MTHQEKQMFVKNQANLKNIWYLVLLFLGVGIILSIYGIFTAFQTVEIPEGGLSSTPGIMLIVQIAVIFLLQIFMLWGAYRLEGWITIFMWLSVIGALFSFDFISLIINLIAVIAYKYILKKIKTSITQTTPPQAVPQQDSQTTPPPPPENINQV